MATRRKPKPWRNLWWITAAILAGAAFSTHPWQVYLEQQRAAAQQRQRLHDVEKQHVLDLELEAKIETGVGREELARKAGFKRPGEEPMDQGQ